MSYLEIRDLRRVYGGGAGVHGFDFSAERGEFVSLLGPSGCGKTTVLRAVAGFEPPDRGVVRLDGRDVAPLPVNRRQIGMVFQNYALFPNMTVGDNVAFGLRIAKRPATEIRARVAQMLDLIQLPGIAGRYPNQLSGGQQQRVALARALAVEPKLLFLDEPLSALDAKVRVAVREEIRSVQRRLGITTLFVTHDQQEALAISDRIVVMNEGRIEQVGTPSEIYNAPRTRFVASFVGTLNLLEGRIVDGGAGAVAVEGQPLRLAAPTPGEAGTPCTLALRPEAIALGAGEGVRNALTGDIEAVEFLGALVRVRVAVGTQRLWLDAFNDPARPLPQPGQAATLTFAPRDLQRLADPA
jgi:putative spermidine/putrescine transport system ATP-binding protein